MSLLSLEESLDLSQPRANELFQKHMNRHLVTAFNVLGFSELDIKSAQGAVITLSDDSEILDFSGGIGICGVGHNHPRIIEAERKCHERQVIDLMRVAPHKLQAALCYNIAQLLPDPLDVSFLTVSGAEAVESAMKLCERIQTPKGKRKFLCMEGAFHGKLHGTLSITTAGRFQRGFLLGLPGDNVIRVPYGDIEAVKQVITDETENGRNEIVAGIIEPIRGEACEVAPAGFLTEFAQVLRDNDIMVIFDEVKTGMGRTGKFCAFQHEDVVPDVVTLAKSLGGAKRALGAMVTSEDNFMKAYGSVQDAALHSTGFGGLGSTCAVGIETLNILVEENLIERSAEMGAYLGAGLQRLAEKHPRIIKGIRGKGLFHAIQFNFGQDILNKFESVPTNWLFRNYQSMMIGALNREVYTRAKVITHFQPGALDILHIMPPLVVEQTQLDQLLNGLDEILTSGILDSTVKFLGANVKRVLGVGSQDANGRASTG